MDTTLPPPRGLPVYPEWTPYLNLGGMRSLPWEFNGWKQESLSWKHGCYIHAGLSDTQFNFEGPDALAFFSGLCVNGFANFPQGSLRHAVMCNEAGLIAQHAVLQRNAEDDLRLFATGMVPWAEYHVQHTKLRVKMRMDPAFLHQVAGPTSLATLERATGESLRDIGFLRFRHATIKGHRVEIARIGMSGTLAFEVRGALEHGPAVYDEIYRVGQDLGIERLGWRTYFVNHVEGGFPQQAWTFFSAAIEDPVLQQLAPCGPPRITGSVDPANLRARFRTPVEVGWQRTVKLDHEFIGRKAIEAEMAQPRRTTVTLRWNPDDVVDIYASLLRPGDEYKTLDLPTTPSFQGGFFAHADGVFRNGRCVGYSAGTVYSYHFREVISMAVVDLECADIGRELVLEWGDHGRRIKQVRATVGRFPYLAEGRNDQVDTAKLG